MSAYDTIGKVFIYPHTYKRPALNILIVQRLNRPVLDSARNRLFIKHAFFGKPDIMQLTIQNIHTISFRIVTCTLQFFLLSSSNQPPRLCTSNTVQLNDVVLLSWELASRLTDLHVSTGSMRWKKLSGISVVAASPAASALEAQAKALSPISNNC